VDPRYFRPTEVETLLGDPTKAKAKLGWDTDHQLCRTGDRDGGSRLHQRQARQLVKLAGFQAYDHHE
jgi:GDPmannose 4,6-dehydratase